MNARRNATFRFSLISVLLGLSGSLFAQASPDELLKQVAANYGRGRLEGPKFTFDLVHKVSDHNPWGADAPAKTSRYESLVIEGLPYLRLVEVNGRPLGSGDAREEKTKYEKAVEDRKHMTIQQRAGALGVDLKMPVEALPELFNGKIANAKSSDPAVILLECEPKAMRPRNEGEKEVMAHSYRLWINKDDLMPVQLESKVINDDAQIRGSRVEKGSISTYKWTKINNNYVLASTRADYRIWFDYQHSAQGHTEETYSNYKELSAKPSN